MTGQRLGLMVAKRHQDYTADDNHGCGYNHPSVCLQITRMLTAI